MYILFCAFSVNEYINVFKDVKIKIFGENFLYLYPDNTKHFYERAMNIF